MKKRLFVAIELPDNFKSPLASHQLALIKDLEIQPRLTAKENLHITVSFLDTVEESLITGLTEELQRVSKFIKPFTLQYSYTTLGPPGRFPSMIWAVFDKHTAFTNLMRMINGAVVKYLKIHKQPVFISSHLEPVPHVTLARLKKNLPPAQIDFAPFSVKDMPVASFTLMHSQLSSNGPAYTALSTFKLK